MSGKRKTYEVTARSGFDGRPLGETFTASLDPDRERRALGRGSIRVVEKAKPGEKEQAANE